MSQENVDLVRRIYEASNRRDDGAALEAISPEIEIHLAGVFPDMEPVYRGHPGVGRWMERTREPWERFSVEPDRIVDLGARVLVLGTFRATGRDGIEVERPFANLWTLRDGLAARMDAYSDQRNALDAVGLSE